MKLYKAAAVILGVSVLLSGCTSAATQSGTTEKNEETAIQTSANKRNDEFSSYDLISKWDNTATTIAMNGNTAVITGNGAQSKDGNIDITAGGTYVISGSLTDGTITVNIAETEKAQLVLNGATVRSAESAAIYVKQADKVVLTLADGTTNTFSDSDGRSDSESELNACICSKSDLTINGTGSLDVTGRYNNAIDSSDDLKIVSGTITVSAVNNAIKGNDCVSVKTANITVTSAANAIKSDKENDSDKGYIYIEDGKFAITATEDGIEAENSVTILGGSFNIKTGGGSANSVHTQEDTFGGGHGNFNGEKPGGVNGERPNRNNSDEMPSEFWGQKADGEMPSDFAGKEAMTRQDAVQQSTQSTEGTVSSKGIKATGSIAISGGTYTVDSCDDSIHTNGSMSISGGTFSLSSGDDGIHADADLTISSGKVTIVKSYEGIEALNIKISGGDISVTSSDDGLNAAGGNDGSSVGGRPGQNGFSSKDSGSITISGGSIFVDASGDGIDSNGSISMSGGTAVVFGPTNSGNGALDYNSDFKLTGGTVLASGSSGMAQSVTASGQGVIQQNVDVAANTLLQITDSASQEIFAFTSTKNYSNFVFTSADVKSGETYKILTGGTHSGAATNGVYSSGSSTGGKEISTVTAK